MKKHTVDMTRGSIMRHIIAFAIPVMIAGVLQTLYNAADTVVVGKFAGKEALAAVGSTGSAINLIIGVFIGLLQQMSLLQGSSVRGIKAAFQRLCILPLPRA